MRRTPIRKVSPKQRAELALRWKLKAKLLKEWNGICPDCGHRPGWPGAELIHRVALSHGGQTTRENCYLGCHRCHAKLHHERIANEKGRGPAAPVD